MVRRAVLAGDAGAVEGEDDRQVHDGHVVEDLVEGALQERRVDRRDRLHPLRGHAAAERHGVLLGDADVEHSIRQRLGELVEPRPLRHRRRDRHDLRVVLGELDQRLREDRGIRRRPGRRLHDFA